MKRSFYGFNNRFRTTKNTEVIVFEKGAANRATRTHWT